MHIKNVVKGIRSYKKYEKDHYFGIGLCKVGGCYISKIAAFLEKSTMTLIVD